MIKGDYFDGFRGSAMFDDYGYIRVRAGSIGQFVRSGASRGLLPGIRGTWAFVGGVLTVRHPVPRSWFEQITRPAGPAREVEYPVPLVAPAAAPGKPRRWFGCPGCGRTCSDLYLKAPQPMLACRRCHRLRYSSQYSTRFARELARSLRFPRD